MDEFALDFSDFWRCAKGDDGERFTAEQIHKLDASDSELGAMSGLANAGLWTEDALRQDARWERIREDARAALIALGWPNEIPPKENM